MCDLYRGYNIIPELMAKVGMRLIHGCDLYTSDYGSLFRHFQYNHGTSDRIPRSSDGMDLSFCGTERKW